MRKSTLFRKFPVSWREEIDRALKAYRQDTGNLRKESADQDDPLQEKHPSKRLLYKVEKKIQNAKHVIRRCRNEHIWIPALVQEPIEPGADITFNLHSLDAQHRYEKALQRYKRRLDQYERIKNTLQEKTHAEKER